MFQKFMSHLAKSITEKASASPRLRDAFHFHNHHEKVQRTVLALQPGTYVRPHCHIKNDNNNGFEMLTILHGSIGVLFFNELGDMIHREKLTIEQKHYLIEIQQGIYHSIVVLSPDTLVLEIKEGPYDALTDKTFLQDFPEEGTPEVEQLVKSWEILFLSPTL